MNWKNMEWRDTRYPLESESLIDEFEELCGYKFPTSFRECVKIHNASSPVWDVFDIPGDSGSSISQFHSFNKQDKLLTIWRALECSQGWLDDAKEYGDEEEIRACENVLNNYVEFASDCCGNPIAFDKTNDGVVFIDHETLEVSYLADSFDEFMGSLHEYKGEDE